MWQWAYVYLLMLEEEYAWAKECLWMWAWSSEMAERVGSQPAHQTRQTQQQMRTIRSRAPAIASQPAYMRGGFDKTQLYVQIELSEYRRVQQG